MISQNQVEGLPEAMDELNRLSSIEVDSVPDTDIDAIFNEGPNIEEEQ